MRFLASHPLTIAKILDSSIKLYIAALPKLAGILALTAIAHIGFTFLNYQMVLATKNLQGGELTTLLPNIGLILAGFFVFIIISLIFYIAIIHLIDSAENERAESLTDTLKFGLQKVPSMTLAMFLYLLAVMLGTLLLVIPGLILMLSLWFYIYYIALESKPAYSSLKASHKLIWGHWWRTMTIYMAPGALVIVIYIAFGALFAFLAIKEPWLQVTLNLLQVFFSSYFAALGYVQFHDLQLRKSGADLAERLAN